MSDAFYAREERSAWPWAVPLLAGAGALAWLYWRHRRGVPVGHGGAPRESRNDDGNGDPARDAPPSAITHAVAPPPAPPGRWVLPVAGWNARAPVVSDGWDSPRDGGRRRHRGVDLMFRRRSLDELRAQFPPRSPHSKWHFMPPGTLVLAASDADVWSAGWTPHGYAVVLSHGTPWATCYRHLANLRVRETQRGSSHERVRAGQPLGTVGIDPLDPNGIAHLHFELWFGGGAAAAIDPTPYLRRWPVVHDAEVT